MQPKIAVFRPLRKHDERKEKSKLGKNTLPIRMEKREKVQTKERETLFGNKRLKDWRREKFKGCAVLQK